jgi:hypothetical protein
MIDTDGKREMLGEKGCPHAAVSTTHLTWPGRCVVVKVAVRVLRLPLSVGRTDISGDGGFRDEGWDLVPKPSTKNSSHQDRGVSVANIKMEGKIVLLYLFDRSGGGYPLRIHYFITVN